MSPNVTSSAASSDAEAGQQRILEAAERLFAESGYDGTSTSAVAAAAGVSKATVFHHFPTKDALYLAVLRNSCRSGTELLAEISGSGLDALARIRRFASEHLQEMCNDEQRARLVLREVTGFGAAGGQAVAEQVVHDHFVRLVGMLREGQTAGLLRDDLDPAAAALTLMGGNLTYFLTRDVLRHLPGGNFADDPAYFSEALASIFFDGVRAGRNRSNE